MLNDPKRKGLLQNDTKINKPRIRWIYIKLYQLAVKVTSQI